MRHPRRLPAAVAPHQAPAQLQANTPLLSWSFPSATPLHPESGCLHPRPTSTAAQCIPKTPSQRRPAVRMQQRYYLILQSRARSAPPPGRPSWPCSKPKAICQTTPTAAARRPGQPGTTHHPCDHSARRCRCLRPRPIAARCDHYCLRPAAAALCPPPHHSQRADRVRVASQHASCTNPAVAQAPQPDLARVVPSRDAVTPESGSTPNRAPPRERLLQLFARQHVPRAQHALMPAAGHAPAAHIHDCADCISVPRKRPQACAVRQTPDTEGAVR